MPLYAVAKLAAASALNLSRKAETPGAKEWTRAFLTFCVERFFRAGAQDWYRKLEEALELWMACDKLQFERYKASTQPW